jgi:hypothetical protein
LRDDGASPDSLDAVSIVIAAGPSDPPAIACELLAQTNITAAYKEFFISWMVLLVFSGA